MCGTGPEPWEWAALAEALAARPEVGRPEERRRCLERAARALWRHDGVPLDEAIVRAFVAMQMVEAARSN
jgi:hypothetical protein